MAEIILPDDLRDIESDNKTKDYYTITVNDLNPGQAYDFQFAWVFPDKTTSEWSATYRKSTLPEQGLPKPAFSAGDLYSGNGFVTIVWRGKDQFNNDMPLSLKQVNIWAKGGAFGSTYTRLADVFTGPGMKKIFLPLGEYTFRLQAETSLGTVSPFSDEQAAWSIKAPKAAANLKGEWVKSDGTTKTDTLAVSFDFDPNFEDETNSNLNTNRFRISLTSGTKTHTVQGIVNRFSTAQYIYVTAQENKAVFGLFATSFTVSIIMVDNNGNESTLVDQETLTYETPLDTPIIVLTAGTLLYNVTWNAQTGKPFDQIYIEEVESNSSVAPSSGWTQVAQGIQNPLTVQTLNANKRWVRAKFYDSNGLDTSYSSAYSVTPTPSVTADNIGPDNVTSVTTSAGIDTSGYLGFNGYIDVSWPSVTGGGIRGYRIRFSNDGGTTYSYVDSPGPGTTYRLGGLAIGSTYKIAVATYDEFNNTSSSYVSATDRLIPGTPSMSKYISAGNIRLGYGVDGLNDVGLYLDSDNYWYLNSSESARLKVGGSTSNYLLWDGAAFAIDGNITARSGYFKGNVEIQSGGSLFSGVLSGGQILGTGYVLNNTGLSFSYGSTEMTTIAASTGKLTTKSANIGGWDVNETTINKNGISLSSAARPSIIANASAYYVGITTPVIANPQTTDIVLWAGQSANGADANFRVTAGGKLYANNATVIGAITATSGPLYDQIINIQNTADGKNKVFYQPNKPTGSSLVNGDVWIDTDDDKKMYTYDADASDFVLTQDSASAKTVADAAADSANDAKSIAEGKSKVTKSTSAPADPIDGDVWIDSTGSLNILKIYNSSTSQWVASQDAGIAAAAAAALAAQEKADEAYDIANGAVPKNTYNATDIITKLNTSFGSTKTVKLFAGGITAGSLLSESYTGPSGQVPGDGYSITGVGMNLDGNGGISAPNFYINGSTGSAFFRGSILSSVITGSTFTSTSYTEANKAGIAIAATPSGQGQAILFSYNSGATVGALFGTSYGITLQGSSSGGGGSILIDNSANQQKVAISSSETIFLSNVSNSILMNKTTGIDMTSAADLDMSGSTRVQVSSGAGMTIQAVGAVSITSGSSMTLSAGKVLTLSATVASLSASHGTPDNGLRNISITSTAGTPSGGSNGDIVLVYA